MTIRKGSLILIIAAALIVGAGTAEAINEYKALNVSGYVSIKQSYYNELEQMSKKYDKLEQLTQFVEGNFYKATDPKSLEVGTYKGLFYGLDDIYSYYLTADEYSALELSMSSEFQGIGITFSYNEQSNLVIVSTMDDSPAQSAGLMPGDVILMVDDIPYTAAEMDEAGAHMRGKPGTKVKLTISRSGDVEEFTITRANIVKHSLTTEMLDGDIAYVRISTFEDKTGDEFQSELRNLELKGVKGMVIDLRNNGGGVLSAGTKIADLLLPECTIVYLVDNTGERVPTNSGRSATSIPYVLLVDEWTASTSEILAAAVKDNKGGALVGAKTFGKGVVQTVMPLSDGSGDAIKLTTSQYLSPNGDVIHEIGVEPDYAVELKPGDTEDYQLEKALELLSE
ncbi:MAG: S41 family peptidase [Clostridiales bacterium]|nr:S41 family peptidase [Clostridiales bacterium]